MANFVYFIVCKSPHAAFWKCVTSVSEILLSPSVVIHVPNCKQILHKIMYNKQLLISFTFLIFGLGCSQALSQPQAPRPRQDDGDGDGGGGEDLSLFQSFFQNTIPSFGKISVQAITDVSHNLNSAVNKTTGGSRETLPEWVFGGIHDVITDAAKVAQTVLKQFMPTTTTPRPVRNSTKYSVNKPPPAPKVTVIQVDHANG